MFGGGVYMNMREAQIYINKHFKKGKNTLNRGVSSLTGGVYSLYSPLGGWCKKYHWWGGLSKSKGESYKFEGIPFKLMWDMPKAYPTFANSVYYWRIQNISYLCPVLFSTNIIHRLLVCSLDQKGSDVRGKMAE